MVFELLEDFVKLSLIIAGLCIGIVSYVHNKRPGWSESLEKRRFTVLLSVILAVFALKISEDVLLGDSGAIDRAVLLYIHSHLPSPLIKWLTLITDSASLKVLAPLTLSMVLALLLLKRRREALLLASSVITSAIVVYIVKLIVNRDRPLLWQTEWYWGSSFPSGHTLVASTFAIASALCIGRIRSKVQKIALIGAVLWLGLVAFSRLALGVHWPTDVLAAICVGVLIPLLMTIIVSLPNSK